MSWKDIVNVFECPILHSVPFNFTIEMTTELSDISVLYFRFQICMSTVEGGTIYNDKFPCKRSPLLIVSGHAEGPTRG